jgi:hypothetical protein
VVQFAPQACAPHEIGMHQPSQLMWVSNVWQRLATGSQQTKSPLQEVVSQVHWRLAQTPQSHLRQDPPTAPQYRGDVPDWQVWVAPSQHPLGQGRLGAFGPFRPGYEQGMHTPSAQTGVGLAHTAQGAPARPQALWAIPG